MKRFAEAFLTLGLLVMAAQAVDAQTITFAPPKQIATGQTGRLQYGQVMVGDFNGDGETDLLVVGAATLHRNVLFGDGKGNFSIVSSNVGSTSHLPILVADLNGDGKDDILMQIILGNPGAPEEVAVFLSDGTGHFTESEAITVPYGIYQALLGDFDNDGKRDFVLSVINADPEHTPVYEQQIFFKGRGDGTFTTSQLGLTAAADLGIEAFTLQGDFNGDGNLDLIFWTVDFDATRIYTSYGRGDGTFSDPQLSYTTDTGVVGPSGISTANLNGDKKMDLIANLRAKGFPASSQPRIASLLAKQTKGFYWGSAVSVTPTPLEAFAADLNGDGKPDLIAFGNNYTTTGAPPFLWIYQGVGGGTFGHQSVVDISSIASASGTTTIATVLAVPLSLGALPSIIIGETQSTAPLQVLVNTTK